MSREDRLTSVSGYVCSLFNGVDLTHLVVRLWRCNVCNTATAYTHLSPWCTVLCISARGLVMHEWTFSLGGIYYDKGKGGGARKRHLSSGTVVLLYVIHACQVWHHSGSDWPKSWLFPIRFQYVFFVSSSQNVMTSWNLIGKSPGFIIFVANLTHFGAKPEIPDLDPLASVVIILFKQNAVGGGREGGEAGEECLGNWAHEACRKLPVVY